MSRKAVATRIEVKFWSLPAWTHDELIRRNIIAYNRDAQIWGWFEVEDNRHWPNGRGADRRTSNRDGGSKAGMADAKGLAALRLRFDENVYYAAPGQGWFNWGVRC